MTTVIETASGRHAVVTSFVTVTLRNAADDYLRVRRWGVNPDIGKDLIQVWMASREEELGAASRVDMFVRDAGSTTSKVGFHRLLADFLGWPLPMVPSFSGKETRLYLEVLFPLFYIEQKFGWSGIAPRIPTHYGIREPLRRAVEYVLGLHTLNRLRQQEALREEEVALAGEWAATVARAHGAANAESLRLLAVSEKPTVSAQRRDAVIEANVSGEWRELSTAVERWQERLRQLQGTEIAAGPRTEQTRAELAIAEREVQRLGAVARHLYEQRAMSQGDADAISARLASMDEDKKRLRDVKRIERLGGEMELPLLAEGRCPTCSQEVDGRDVATETVSSVEENISLLDAERVTLLSMQSSAAQRTNDITRSIAAAEAALSEARDRVRLLRDELVGPSNAPSVAEVQERLSLESRLRAAGRVSAIVGAVNEELDELAVRLDDLRVRRANADSGEVDEQDRKTLRQFRSSFQEQLAAYNLRSLSPEAVSIDEKTLLPVNDGFELTFDVAMGISASDTIRTKWAYYTALMETAQRVSEGRHLGLLMLDEPRQQETDRPSLAAFLQRLRDDSQLAQIVYATSEDPKVLDQLLVGVPYNNLPADGRHLIDFR
ncbi:hypothetical protein [Micromonospora tulbaghiae]|nr:hypothetical protein [Micromonospora tulbaghiae]